jgi:hypothetical protein
VRPVLLPYLSGAQETFELAFAEAAAGGGGAYVEPGTAATDLRRRYKALYRKHPELFDGLLPYAHIGVYLNWMHLRFADRNHLRAFYDLHRRLSEDRYLVDVITPESEFDGLNRLHVLCIGDAMYVSEKEHGVLEQWVRDGGILILTGEFAKYSDYARPSSSKLTLIGILSDLKKKTGSDGYATTDFGKGKVVWARQIFPNLFPKNATDLNNAIEGKEEKMFKVAAELAGAGESAVPIDRNSTFCSLLKDLTGGVSQPIVPVLNNFLGLKFTAYRSPKRLVIHALNYNAPVRNTSGAVGKTPAPQPFEPMRDIPVSLHVDAQVRSVQAIDPRSLAQSALKFQNSDGICTFVIPEVVIHKIIDIGLG